MTEIVNAVAGAVTEALAYADDIIKRSEEELRLIRMKDCGAVYDVLLRNIGFGMWPDKLKAALQSSGGAAGEPPAQPAGEGEAVAWRYKLYPSDKWTLTDSPLAPNELGERGVQQPLYTATRGEREAPTHRHVKSGHDVTVIATGKMQAGDDWRIRGYDDAWMTDTYRQRADMAEVIIYRHDGNWWVRPREEFEDGRFVALPSDEEQ